MKKNKIIILGIILFSFIFSIYMYPYMLEKMASHWDTQEQINGFMPKFLGLFLIPIFLVGLALIFTTIPKIKPLNTNIEKFKNIIIILLFYSYYFYFQFIFK